MPLEISLSDQINTEEIVDLYKASQWSSAGRPNELLARLRNWHSLVTARRAEKMIGIGNAISDGHLVVYFPHRLVQPALQGQAIGFYKAPGFVRAGATGPMWLPAGHEH